MTPNTFWANLTPAQQNRLYRLRCTKCKRSLRRAMVDECKCDTVGNATDALKASAYPHINTVSEATHVSA